MSLTICCFVVYSTRRFVLCLALYCFVLVFVSPFSIAITSFGEERVILVLLLRLFYLRLFGFVCFLFILVSGKGCGVWLWHSLDFSLTFFSIETITRRIKLCSMKTTNQLSDMAFADWAEETYRLTHLCIVSHKRNLNKQCRAWRLIWIYTVCIKYKNVYKTW